MKMNKPGTEGDATRSVDGVIADFIARRQASAAIISPQYKEVWDEIGRLLGSGGKRFRSKMALLSYKAFGGTDEQAVMPVVAALELLHMAMLIHDDIIDRDYVRYGVDNIAGSYNKIYDELVPDAAERLHYAHSVSLLAGDVLLSEAYVMMTEAAIEPKIILAVQRLLGMSIFEVIGGELLDTEATFRGSKAAATETIALYKTASYTTTLPLLVGAELAGVSEDDKRLVRAFGNNLGIAFQLRDDVIGVFGNEAETGKTTMGDLREGKRTYLIEQFYALTTPEQRAVFIMQFGNPALTQGEATALREVLEVSGALAATERAISNYETKARMALARLPFQPDYLEAFDNFILRITKRKK